MKPSLAGNTNPTPNANPVPRRLRNSALLTLGSVGLIALVIFQLISPHLALDGRAVLFAAFLMSASFFLSCAD